MECSCLTAEAVEGAALPLEGIDDIHGRNGLPLGMFGVGDGITDDVLKEHLEDTTGLLVDQARDTLDTATAGQTANGGLRDALDVVTQHLAMTLGATLSESFASFATSSHVEFNQVNDENLLFGVHFMCAKTFSVESDNGFSKNEGERIVNGRGETRTRKETNTCDGALKKFVDFVDSEPEMLKILK